MAVAVPIGLSLSLMLASLWIGLFGGVNLYFAARDQSLVSLSRSVEWFSRSLQVSSWVVRGWGSASILLPAMDPVAELGDSMAQVAAAGTQFAPLLPDALGVNGPRRYLVCQLNDAELFGAGGAPLEATMIEFDRGKVTFPASGAVSTKLNPHNEAYKWKVKGGRPWYVPGKEYPFANSNFHPDFLLSGTNLISAWDGLDLPQADAVLTVDVYAVAQLLRATGPIQSDVYGELTADNVVETLLVEAYRKFPEESGAIWERKEANRQLRKDLFARLTNPRVWPAAVSAIWGSLPSRHIQAFARDSDLQGVVATLGADAVLVTAPGDILGVFIQCSPTKLAIFQRRTIRREVDIHSDGSADVRQKVLFTNDVPKGLKGYPNVYKGYLGLMMRQRVAYRLPATASGTSVELAKGRSIVRPGRTGPFRDSAGGSVLWQGQDIKPRKSSTTKVAYSLPAGTFGGPTGIRYHLTANPQAVVIPVQLEVVVNFPEGTTPDRPREEGWTVSGQTAQWRGILDRTLSLTVEG